MFDEASTCWAPEEVLPDSKDLKTKVQEKLGEASEEEKLQEPKEASSSPKFPKEKNPR